MADTELLKRLRDLHKELANISEQIKPNQQVDEATDDALEEIVRDVGNLVNRSNEVKSETEHEDDHSELHDRIVKFEADHPQVTSFLAQISEVLANMGI